MKTMPFLLLPVFGSFVPFYDNPSESPQYFTQFRAVLYGKQHLECNTQLSPEHASLCNILKKYHIKHEAIFTKINGILEQQPHTPLTMPICTMSPPDMECLVSMEDRIFADLSSRVNQAAQLDEAEHEIMDQYQEDVWFAVSLVRGMRPHHHIVYFAMMIVFLGAIIALLCLATKKWMR